jgi:chromosome segregation ATPase
LNKKIEQSEKDWENNNKNMGNIKLILNKEKENKIIYLKNLYSIVNKEINNILQDINFKPYHNKLIENKELDLEEKEINLEEKILNSLNKLIIFLDELKYDYIQTKKENYEIIKQKANDNYKILKNENDYNIYKNELDEYKVQIDKLINENKILKEEIEINSQNNKMKELNDYNFKDINSEEMKQQIIELKDNNNQLIRKLRDVNDGNYELEQKNNVLENEMGKLKGYEQMLEQLKEKYDNLSFDYQRIQRENSSLKNLINNNQ